MMAGPWEQVAGANLTLPACSPWRVLIPNSATCPRKALFSIVRCRISGSRTPTQHQNILMLIAVDGNENASSVVSRDDPGGRPPHQVRPH